MAACGRDTSVPTGSGNAEEIFDADADGGPAREIIVDYAGGSSGNQDMRVIVSGYTIGTREFRVLSGNTPNRIRFEGEESSGPRGLITSVSVYALTAGKVVKWAVSSR